MTLLDQDDDTAQVPRNHSELGALKIVDRVAWRRKIQAALERHALKREAAADLGVSTRQLERYLADIAREDRRAARRASTSTRG